VSEALVLTSGSSKCRPAQAIGAVDRAKLAAHRHRRSICEQASNYKCAQSAGNAPEILVIITSRPAAQWRGAHRGLHPRKCDARLGIGARAGERSWRALVWRRAMGWELILKWEAVENGN
jgi:hypothetical protein